MLALLSACCLPITARAVSLADIPVGTGYAAWEICSRAIAGGDDMKRVRTEYTEPKVPPLPKIWWVDVEPGKRVEIGTWLPGVPDRRVGIFRPGLGCTLVTPDTTEAAVRAQPFKPVAAPAPIQAPWPDGEAAPQPGLLSPAQLAVIQSQAKVMFSEVNPEPNRKLHTTALLVAKDGKLLHEEYRAGYQRMQLQLGWSMTKTVTSLIAGLMHRDGRLKLDEPVGLPAWQDTPKAAITWRQLLNFAPGLAWDESYGGHSDVTHMLYNVSDQGNWAAQRPLSAKPGTVFTYSTGYSNIAMLALRRMAGGSHQGIYDYYQQRLFTPLGMQGGVIEPDASGTPVGGARGLLRPVDWLRLGQLVANRGVWKGQTLISPDYMDFVSAPSPASAEYGGGIWRLASPSISPALQARLPSDLVWFLGHVGQIMVVVPSRNLVVLRMGVAFDSALAKTQVFTLVADLLDAK
jgi:CubicO group peptidase (beta-lactamase class C family)